MYFSGTLLVALVCARAALAWTWPREPQESQESVRVYTKVRFLDAGTGDKSVYTSTDITKRGNVQSDETPFRQPAATDGFYNRPPGDGRYPVEVVRDPQQSTEGVYRVQTFKDDGTEIVTFCKCISSPECNPRHDSAELCGDGKYLCCYKRPNKNQPINSDFFNEIEDERLTLLPGREGPSGPFPPPPNSYHPTINEHLHFVPINEQRRPVLVGPGGPTGNIEPTATQRPVLVGPGGPTGVIGPEHQNDKRGLLVGPNGPSGVIGPREPAGFTNDNRNAGADSNRGVLVGPDGPTGVIGPNTHQNLETSAAAQRGILVGPGGPTGIIGPYGLSGNRGVLVGPRGPTGIIGPNRSRGVLVGPGGPRGIIGPAYSRQLSHRQQSGPGLLVGPGGPTGSIGPGRQLLTGPDGPTGRIGPQSYYYGIY